MQSTPHVLVDGRPLSDSNKYRGIGTFVRELLTELGRRPTIRVSALATNPDDLPLGIRPIVINRRAPGRFARLEHDLLLAGEIRRAKADVFHSPALHPPKRCRIPWVQTVHDVIPLTFAHPDFVSQQGVWREYTRRVRKATAVVTDSYFVAAEAARVLDLDRSIIRVAHLGVSPEFKPSATTDPKVPYLLFVGEPDPRKGHREAFDVVGRLAERGFPHQLKVVGRIAPWFEAEVRKMAAASRRPDRIELLGFVPDIKPLYRDAAALLVTSRSEGFGLPALEAMASGTPVVGFDNSSTTEVVGESGVLAPDGDVEAVTELAASVLQDPTLRMKLSGRAILRATEFTWAGCADIYCETYLQLAGQAS